MPRAACPTGKHRYRDLLAAQYALSKIAFADREGRDERRAYECPACKGAHLTSQPADTGPSRKVRALVWARDDGRCVACGTVITPGMWRSIQHRLARAHGGCSEPPNLILLCGSATSAGCHRRAEDRDEEYRRRGYWIRSGVSADPAGVPVLVVRPSGTRWVRLTADGRYAGAEPQREAS